MTANIYLGRERAEQILNQISVDDAEFLYGDAHDGIGYCPFKFKRGLCWFGATVRTSQTNYIKIDKRVLMTNVDRCETYEIEHVLILGFRWGDDNRIFMIFGDHIKRLVSYVTKGWGYWVYQYMDIIRYLERDGTGIEVVA